MSDPKSCAIGASYVNGNDQIPISGNVDPATQACEVIGSDPEAPAAFLEKLAKAQGLFRQWHFLLQIQGRRTGHAHGRLNENTFLLLCCLATALTAATEPLRLETLSSIGTQSATEQAGRCEAAVEAAKYNLLNQTLTRRLGRIAGPLKLAAGNLTQGR